MMCFTFNEQSMLFEALGLNSRLQFVKTHGGGGGWFDYGFILNQTNSSHLYGNYSTEWSLHNGLNSSWWKLEFVNNTGGGGFIHNQTNSSDNPTNSSHSLHNYSTGWWWWDDETGWWGDHYIHSSPSPTYVGDRRSAQHGQYPSASLASVVDGMLERLVAEGDGE